MRQVIGSMGNIIWRGVNWHIAPSPIRILPRRKLFSGTTLAGANRQVAPLNAACQCEFHLLT